MLARAFRLEKRALTFAGDSFSFGHEQKLGLFHQLPLKARAARAKPRAFTKARIFKKDALASDGKSTA
jgi:hypothetical protein